MRTRNRAYFPKQLHSSGHNTPPSLPGFRTFCMGELTARTPEEGITESGNGRGLSTRHSRASACKRGATAPHTNAHLSKTRSSQSQRRSTSCSRCVQIFLTVPLQMSHLRRMRQGVARRQQPRLVQWPLLIVYAYATHQIENGRWWPAPSRANTSFALHGGTCFYTQRRKLKIQKRRLIYGG